jgi:hypothetical protein
MNPRVSLCYAFGFLLLAVLLPVRAADQPNATLVFLTPQDGQIVLSPGPIEIQASFQPVTDFGATGVNAQVVADGLGQHIVIAKGDILFLDNPDRISALWDLTKVTPGDYVITATVKAADQFGTASVNVTVHPAPVAEMRLQSFQFTPQGTQIVLTASASSPSQTQIVDYFWNPGDGSPPQDTSLPSFTHLFPSTGTFVVVLEVLDALGGSQMVIADLFVAAPNLRRPESCGCNQMTIKTVPGASDIICGAQTTFASTSGCTLMRNPPAGTCAQGQVAWTCPLGPVTPAPPANNLGYGFEVFADLVPGSSSRLCKEGQFVQATRTGPVLNPRTGMFVLGTKTNSQGNQNVATMGNKSTGSQNLPGGAAPGGFMFNSVGPAAKVPPFGATANGMPNYGPDDYISRPTYKNHQPQVIFWWDEPKVFVDGISGSGNEEFVDFVQGNMGSCWCRFTLRQTWPGPAGPIGGAGFTMVDGENCVIR